MTEDDSDVVVEDKGNVAGPAGDKAADNDSSDAKNLKTALSSKVQPG